MRSRPLLLAVAGFLAMSGLALYLFLSGVLTIPPWDVKVDATEQKTTQQGPTEW
jgi:hypothetical protein